MWPMEQQVSTYLKGYHQAEHVLYKSQKGIHNMPFFLELMSQMYKILFFRVTIQVNV
jgi:hypothetical protein